MTWRIEQGNCIAVMATMPAESVDAIVTDPPYGLGFMGRAWDTLPPGLPWGQECLRLLKPGGHLLAFGGTRTSHRLVCAIEDAGFEIRDTIMWMYGSGFPKSHDVSKAIDKTAGAEREVIGPKASNRPNVIGQAPGGSMAGGAITERFDTAPATPDAERWQGWGTALKPAYEPIVMARKPLVGTVAANVLQHGTGALNIDGCRIATNGDSLDGGRISSSTEGWDRPYKRDPETRAAHVLAGAAKVAHAEQAGRWPANVILSHSPGCREVGTRRVRGDNRATGNGTRPAGFANIGSGAGDGEPNGAVYGDAEVTAWDCVEDCAVRLLDEQTGDLTTSMSLCRRGATTGTSIGGGAAYGTSAPHEAIIGFGDKGGASRFFYCPKADSAERHAGLSVTSLFTPQGSPERNDHPTVKPIALMRWLVRLVTPPGGTVLDPFTGSGTTGCASVSEGLNFRGVEQQPEYVAIATARIAHYANGSEPAWPSTHT